MPTKLAAARASGKGVRLQDAAIPKTDTGTNGKMNHNVAKTFLFNNLRSIAHGTCRATMNGQRGK